MKDDDKAVIVCALATAKRAVPGSVFHHRCSYCSSRLMTAPSGQAFLKLHPDSTLACEACYQNLFSGLPTGLTADRATIAREVLSAKPNPWNKRN